MLKDSKPILACKRLGLMNSESPNRQNYLPSVYGLNVFSEGPPVLPLWVGGSPLKKRVRSALLLKHRLRASESRCGEGKGQG